MMAANETSAKASGGDKIVDRDRDRDRDVSPPLAAGPGGGAGVYVNQGLLNFERKRALWLSGALAGEKDKSATASVVAITSTEVRAKVVDVEDVVDKIFSQTGNGQLSHPLPLGQMIDILVEFWEADGLYD